MLNVIIFFSVLFTIISLTLLFIPGAKEFRYAFIQFRLIIPITLILITLVLLIIDNIKNIIKFFRMIKEIGWKATLDYYKKQRKLRKKKMSPEKKARKEAIKRFFN